MNHSRRNFFAALAGVAAAAGVKAEGQVIESTPRPLALVLRCEGRLSCAQRKGLRESWGRMHQSLRDIPLVVLDDGMEIQAIRG